MTSRGRPKCFNAAWATYGVKDKSHDSAPFDSSCTKCLQFFNHKRGLNYLDHQFFMDLWNIHNESDTFPALETRVQRVVCDWGWGELMLMPTSTLV